MYHISLLFGVDFNILCIKVVFIKNVKYKLIKTIKLLHKMGSGPFYMNGYRIPEQYTCIQKIIY